MLTPAQIAAESITPPLTDVQVMNLTLLVRRFPVYYNNLGLFPDFLTKLTDEKATPTVKTQALKAVLTQVGNLPEFVVESQGSREEPSHFTTNENWYDLAMDVLNLYYEVPMGLGRQNYALAQTLSYADILGIYRENVNVKL